MRARGMRSTRPSSSAWVSLSIHWRSSRTRRRGWLWLSRSRSALDGVERSLAALRRIELRPPRVLGRRVEQGQEGGKRRLERLVEGAAAGRGPSRGSRARSSRASIWK